jgi:hypothetical protein
LTTHTSTRTVTFARPFTLDEVDHELPAGTYEIETEEATIDGLSFLARRRVSTHIYIRAGHEARMQAIDPVGLETALARDRGLA